MMWHFFDKDTGHYLGRRFEGPLATLKDNTPSNAIAVAANGYDPTRKRWEGGELKDYEPIPVQDNRTQLAIRSRIRLLETKQLRALREIALGYDGAPVRLQQIDNEITQLRTQLNG
jgi:hypothetical protein